MTTKTANANNTAKNETAETDAVEKKTFSYTKLFVWTAVVAAAGTGAYFLFKGGKVAEVVAETTA